MFFIDKPLSDKPTVILLKTYLPNGKRFVYSIGENILPSHWSKNSRRPIAARGTLGARLSYISERIDIVDKIYTQIIRTAKLNAIPITANYLRTNLDKKVKGEVSVQEKRDLVSIINYHIEYRKNDPSFSASTKTRYVVLSRLIAEFDKIEKRQTFIADITQKWYFDFLNYLFEMHKYLDNTAGSLISKLKCVISWAQKQRMVTVDISAEALENLITIRRESDQISLSFDEIEQIENAELGGNETLERVRDLFLIGCYSGQRFSDYSVFEKSEYRDGVIYKVAEKTEMTSYIPVDSTPPLKRLLEKYDWKLPKISNQKFNDYIKTVVEKAGIDTPVKQTYFRGKEKIETITPKFNIVSSHTARRTFITLSSQSAIDDKSIMKIAGIRNISTLHNYNKSSIEQLNEQMVRLNSLRLARQQKNSEGNTSPLPEK